MSDPFADIKTKWVRALQVDVNRDYDVQKEIVDKEINRAIACKHVDAEFTLVGTMCPRLRNELSKHFMIEETYAKIPTDCSYLSEMGKKYTINFKK